VNDPVARIPEQRDPHSPEIAPIPLQESLAWHRPGIHRVRLHGRDIWVRMDERGIASMSSLGPDKLARVPLEQHDAPRNSTVD
jgi:hypothetical protein